MRFYVGTYNREGPYFQATGQGLHTCELDRQTGCIAALAVNGDIVNATYLAKQPGANRLFAACDLYLSPGILCGCDIQDDGSVACRSARSAHGQSVCHVARNTVGTIAAVSSYLDGKISLHAINGTMICDVSTVWQYTGSSVNARRQESAHAHQAVFAPNDSAL